jgi:hypothetical protein
MVSLVQPDAFLQMDSMADDRFVVVRKCDLAGVPRGAGLGQKGADEELVEEQIVAQDEQLLATRRDLGERVNLKGATAVRRKHIALVQPERLIQNPQVACRFTEWRDDGTLTNSDTLHSCFLLYSPQRPV